MYVIINSVGQNLSKLPKYGGIMTTEEKSFVDGVLEYYGHNATNLIAIMQKIQKQYRYLSKEVLIYISAELGVSDAHTYSVATFYENFSLEAKGKYVIRVCDGTACHVRKSIPVLNAILGELGLVNGGKTTDDMMFTVETVSCLGACGLAPVLTVNDVVHAAMTPDKAKELIREIRKAEAENGKN